MFFEGDIYVRQTHNIQMVVFVEKVVFRERERERERHKNRRTVTNNTPGRMRVLVTK